MTGEGLETGLFGVTAVAFDPADTEDLGVGAVAAVKVGEPPGVSSVVGPGEAVACGGPVTVMAGRGSAFAGALEFRAARPIAQVPIPSVPVTAQVTADFDHTMLAPSDNYTLTLPGPGRAGRADESPLIPTPLSWRSHLAVATKCSAIASRPAARSGSPPETRLSRTPAVLARRSVASTWLSKAACHALTTSGTRE